MPLYAWKCAEHGEFERSYKMDQKPQAAPCPDCKAPSPQIVKIGGVQGDEPSWLYHPEVQGCLQKDPRRPIENRTQYKKYLKDNDIVERS